MSYTAAEKVIKTVAEYSSTLNSKSDEGFFNLQIESQRALPKFYSKKDLITISNC